MCTFYKILEVERKLEVKLVQTLVLEEEIELEDN